MNKSEALNFVNILKQTYPDAQCSLDFNTPFQLAVAVMLSAQCTDERVNKTTPTLFKKCKTIEEALFYVRKTIEEKMIKPFPLLLFVTILSNKQIHLAYTNRRTNSSRSPYSKSITGISINV